MGALVGAMVAVWRMESFCDVGQGRIGVFANKSLQQSLFCCA